MTNVTRIWRVLLTTVAACALSAGTAQAATFAVNQHDDVVGNTGCPSVCTLRAALSAASSNNNEDDVIVLETGSYTVNSQIGPLAVSPNATRITVRGAGANATTIAALTTLSVRVLTINSGAGVTLRDVTLRDGFTPSDTGGNLWVRNGATVNLDRVRITGGGAPQGGGISLEQGGATTTLNVSSSLIDNNRTSGSATTNVGGGIYAIGQTSASIVTIQDSTITGNDARNGGGIYAATNTQVTLRGVTLARNNARAGVGAAGTGGIFTSGATARFQGSIVAGNTVTPASTAPQPSNCSLSGGTTDELGNVTPNSDCGLGGVHVDPQLAPALDESQQPPVLVIPANSPAVDIADCAGRTLDQRGVPRPQGAACDAGAFEYQAPPPPPPTPTPTPPVPTPTPTPGPVAGQSVGAKPLSGKVLVKLPGTTKFVPLDPSVIKNGAEVDTRKGVVEITRSDGGVAKFYDGIFKLSQSGGITTLTLTEKLTGCPKAKKKASAAAKKPKTRKLWGDGKGKFRTRGQYSAATIRGTKWLVQDGCRYTRTRVNQGTVTVRDEVKKKSIVLRKGKTYTARPRA